jgi:hypothetical protein
MKMTFKQSLLASSISLILLGLVGCSDSDVQDEQDEDETSFTGLVVDGRIARGFVWVDTDSDGIIDTYEPYAYTDSDGYFTYNPLTNTNYCATDGHQYCLETGMVQGDYLIKVAGGIDLSTGEKFKGVMTINGNLAEAKEIEQQVVSQGAASDSKPDFLPVISPLTSMVANLTAEDKVKILTNIGIPNVTVDNVDELLNKDYTDIDVNDEDAAEKIALFGYAFKTQKLIDTLALMLDTYLEEQGYDLGQDSDGNPGIGSTADIITQLVQEYLNGDDEGEGKFGNVSANRLNLTVIIPEDPSEPPIVMTSILEGAIDFVAEIIPDIPNSEERPIQDSFINNTASVGRNVNQTVDQTVLTSTSPEQLLTGIQSTQVVANTISNNA